MCASCAFAIAVTRRTTSVLDQQALMTSGPRFPAATPQGEEPTPARVIINASHPHGVRVEAHQRTFLPAAMALKSKTDHARGGRRELGEPSFEAIVDSLIKESRKRAARSHGVARYSNGAATVRPTRRAVRASGGDSSRRRADAGTRGPPTALRFNRSRRRTVSRRFTSSTQERGP